MRRQLPIAVRSIRIRIRIRIYPSARMQGLKICHVQQDRIWPGRPHRRRRPRDVRQHGHGLLCLPPGR